MIKLYPSKEFRFPIFAECINPDVILGKTLDEIETLKVWEGNKQRKLGELFKVEVAGDNDGNITIQGNLSKVRKIGAGMKNGEITIHGNVGMHLGEEMQGGKITVYGNVGGWTGSMMRGGIIEIHGNAGNYLGAPYRGYSEGMKGGKIIVHGDVGNEAGAYMRDGTIKVYGCAGQFAGLRMKDGTIYIQNDAGTRAGACMKGGKIIVGGRIESVLPSFTIEGVKEKVKVEEGETAIGPFYLFVGDLVEHGDGKLYISKDKNPHLSFYEKFL
ncbi:MAG: formylmethanofuran dehydrogenase subunit C [Candidatus Bathyarchaeia archaeon]